VNGQSRPSSTKGCSPRFVAEGPLSRGGTGRLGTVLRRTIRGAERRLYDPSETSASPWLHCAIHQSLGPALQVALSGQELPFAMGFRLTWERTFVEMPAR